MLTMWLIDASTEDGWFSSTSTRQRSSSTRRVHRATTSSSVSLRQRPTASDALCHQCRCSRGPSRSRPAERSLDHSWTTCELQSVFQKFLEVQTNREIIGPLLEHKRTPVGVPEVPRGPDQQRDYWTTPGLQENSSRCSRRSSRSRPT